MNRFEEIFQILSSDSKDDKIKVLESLSQTNNPEIIRKIISKLDDPEIAVRGEAFSSLLLNENKISEFFQCYILRFLSYVTIFVPHLQHDQYSFHEL